MTSTTKPRKTAAPFLVRRAEAIARMQKNAQLIEKYKQLNADTESFDYDEWAEKNKTAILNLVTQVPVDIDARVTGYRNSMGPGHVTITLDSKFIPGWPLKPDNPQVTKETIALVNDWCREESNGRGKALGSKYSRMVSLIELMKLSDEQYVDAKFYDELSVFLVDLESKLAATNTDQNV